MKQKPRYRMTDRTRSLMLLVINDNPQLLPIMHQLLHYRHCDNFLRWLCLNKITGSNLIDWLKVCHNNSILNMVKFIIKSCEKNKELRPVMLGKDWIR